MKRETLEKIRNILEYLFVLFMFILIMLITFGSLHVHAAESWVLESNPGTYDFTVNYNDQWGNPCTTDHHLILSSDVYYAFVDMGESSYASDPSVKGHTYKLCYYNSFSKSVSLYTDNASYPSFFSDYNSDMLSYYQSLDTYYNSSGDIYHNVSSGTSPFYASTLITTVYYNKHVTGTVTLPLPVFKNDESMKNYCLTGDKSGMISGPVTPGTNDESYTYTGFSVNGKTASWTGTTQRSHLLDQDVEEYTTFTYGFATSEDQTVSNFIEYAGEYATADKKLKLPWDEMDTKKKDGEFIRQVNITPCYRVPGAFYRGVGAKVYFHKDGSIDKVVMDTKRTDLNTGNMVYDSSLGYLQNVIYTEEKTHDGKGRQATFKWSTQKSLPEDAQVEIVAQNFYIEWFNKKTQENFVYKEYGEDCIYSTGSYSFNANTPVWTWLKEKEIDPFSIKTQSYGTTEYYLRIVTYDETDLKYHYGGWVRVDIKEKTATRVPSTDVETGDFDDIDGLWKQDTTSDDSYHYSTDDEGKLTGNIDVNSWEDLNMNSFTWLFRNLQSMVSSLGEFPNMITSVFGFLPVQFVTALGVFLVAIVLLRFLGR